MDYPRIRAFLEVADCLNFTQAAEQLYMSQSALSKTIAHLESEFGFPLFVRTNRSVTLTCEGALLRERLRASVGAVEDAIIDARRMKRGRAGMVRLAFESLAVLPTGVWARLGAFSRVQRRFELRPVQCLLGQARQKLIRGEVDCALMPADAARKICDADSLALGAVRLALLCRAGHPAVRSCEGIGACIPLPDEAPEEIALVWKRANDNPALARFAAFARGSDSNPVSP